MSFDEELYKLLNNEFIEEGMGWLESDTYYCENKDDEVMQYLKFNMDSDFSIKSVVYTFYQILGKRYHNNFYLEFIPSQDELVFILRGQPIINSNTLNIIVKYILTISVDDCTLTTNFIIPENSEFNNEKSYVDNYQETTENNEVIDNSSSIKILLDSISLRNYVNKINNNSSNKTDETIDIDDKEDYQETVQPIEKTESLIYCPKCGEANYSLNRKCQKCKTTLLSYMTDYGNEILSYDEILCEEAIKRIEKTKIPKEFYEYVLETITNKCKNINFTEDISVFDQILHITRKFVNVQFDYKSNKNLYGTYSYDTVYINSNQSYSQQCSSLIKYLSVEIHQEIMEALFMYIFDVKNNALVRNFIDYCRITDGAEKIIHTYYPIQVESHFIPNEYHSYEEISLLEGEIVIYKKELTPEQFKFALIIGNTYAQDINKVLDKIITEDIKKNLAEEFKYDKELRVKECINFNIKEILNYEDLIKVIKANMIKAIKNSMNNENIRKELQSLQERFEGKGDSI